MPATNVAQYGRSRGRRFRLDLPPAGRDAEWRGLRASDLIAGTVSGFVQFERRKICRIRSAVRTVGAAEHHRADGDLICEGRDTNAREH